MSSKSELAGSADVDSFLSEIERFPIDRTSILQDKLNLVNRNRTSLFPWRGQFSPELIELLLSYYANPNSTVLDPFVGSGTTLFEAARKSLSCYGAEIIPAAVEMSRTVHFANLSVQQRVKYIQQARSIIGNHLPGYTTLFPIEKQTNKTKLSIEEAIRKMLNEASKDQLLHNILINAVMGYMNAGKSKKPNDLLDAYHKHVNIILSLPFTPRTCRVYHCDARQLPIKSATVDLIITSPPYINVFNYHQNHRKAMELADWDLLEVAKSEIGSNRKNRGNRFLTVIQYAMDMLQALCEMRRVIRPNGRIIVVIGRESTIRGIRFKNYSILSALAVGGAGMKLICRQERKFVTRYGEAIYEDLLHFVPTEERPSPAEDFAREIALHSLKSAMGQKTSDDIHRNIASAIANARTVMPSPLFKLENLKPQIYRGCDNESF